MVVYRGWAREADWRIVLFVMFSLWVCPVRELKENMKLIIKGGLKKVLGLALTRKLIIIERAFKKYIFSFFSVFFFPLFFFLEEVRGQRSIIGTTNYHVKDSPSLVELEDYFHKNF